MKRAESPSRNADRIRVLIVDDSVTYRSILREVLASHPRIEVVSQASNGRLALPRLRHLQPDLVTLDQEMPEMTGLELLEIMRRDFPHTRVIMFSSHTLDGARDTLKALNLGAADFLKKPEGGNARIESAIRERLIPRILALHEHRAESRPSESSAPAAPVRPEPRPIPERGSLDYALIGISTGGPAALRLFFESLGRAPRGAILIVQHMPPLFTQQLAETLNAVTTMTVVEAEDGMLVREGFAYIAPGGRHMAVFESEDAAQRPRIAVLDTPPEANCRPSVNVLFRSFADTAWARKAVALIMTGMGEDGYLGLRALREAGTYVLAQTRSSCMIFGMPARPLREGLVDELHDVPSLARRVRELLGASS